MSSKVKFDKHNIHLDIVYLIKLNWNHCVRYFTRLFVQCMICNMSDLKQVVYYMLHCFEMTIQLSCTMHGRNILILTY